MDTRNLLTKLKSLIRPSQTRYPGFRSADGVGVLDGCLLANDPRFKVLANLLPQVVWTTNAQGEANFFNDRWTALTGLSLAESLGHGWQVAIHPEDRAHDLAIWAEALRQGRTFESEHRLREANGQYRWTLCRAEPLCDEQGCITAWLGTNTDISEIKRVSDELSRAKELADAASQAKSQFLANMSHEMRTPLGVMMGFSEILREGPLDQGQIDHYLDTILRNGEILTRLIDDILDLSKIEFGRLELEPGPTSLATVFGEVQALLADHAAAKSLTLSCETEASLPPKVLIDARRLRQILTNVVGNALKFTEQGGVWIRARALPSPAPGRIAIEITVRDSGLGIAPEHQVRLFEPFSQVDATSSRRHGGMGLGLALSRRLARLLGGDVTLVETSVGQGSVFAITVIADAA